MGTDPARSDHRPEPPRGPVRTRAGRGRREHLRGQRVAVGRGVDRGAVLAAQRRCDVEVVLAATSTAATVARVCTSAATLLTVPATFWRGWQSDKVNAEAGRAAQHASQRAAGIDAMRETMATLQADNAGYR